MRSLFSRFARCPISSNATFQTAAVLTLLAHVGVLLAVWLSPSGSRILLLLNAVITCAVLLYAASRARYIWAESDWPYVGLIGLELLVLTAAVFAFRGHRVAAVGSYVAFGLHGLVSLAAVVYAFAFKMRLM